MTPEELVGQALAVSAEGLRAGELPVGAVVVMGDEVVGRAHTQEVTQGRRLVHADLLAMIEADSSLGWRKRTAPLRLGITLEPCVMCLGAAMSLGVTEIYYGLASPGDGAAGIAASWRPANDDMPFYRMPSVSGGIREADCRDQFRAYCDTAPESGMLRWAKTMILDPM
ncbi:tRNA-specific adenosine deaminase [Rhizocola hellebori]|uniref:tRNA-specific adenosine deaminase n=1 Tax=Rhizocola hellebori TaxID=1392758 RepID=A0A8J3VL23_9ACTN|nr:deaminase [Rhizocola hellebori]GIH11064.1 tRNA-specific adenosine deaminase [Rhizocola hellebori]